MTYGGIFDYTAKRERLTELQGELENPEIWNNPERAQELGRERARLEKDVNVLDRLEVGLTEAGELLELKPLPIPPRLSERDGEGFKFNAAELMQ